MKIPANAVIERDKLTHYLLALRRRSDKSQFLAKAGFTQQDPGALEIALRKLIAEQDAISDRSDEYGVFYQVNGQLRGPLGILHVTTVWIRQHVDGVYRFVTLKPYRHAGGEG